MKKKIFYRALIGFPIGISIGNLIMILISLGWANGYYSPCVPDLITAMGSEINAVIIQTVLCGLLGSGFSVISVIMLPIAYFMYWMEHSVTGFLSYFGIFILIFAVIWIVQFIIGKKNIKRMNEKLSETRNTDSNN